MNNGIPPNLDEDNIISCIVTLGSPINGDDTNYYDGLNNNWFRAKKMLVLFKHYQLQIRCRNKIYVGVCFQNDNRITLNFNLKKLIEHSQSYGM